MTDQEIRKLCAEAMGWKYLGPVGVVLKDDERRGSVADERYPGKLWCLSGANDWWEDPEGHSVCGPCQGIPDPLNDDAVAMALVKRFSLAIQPPQFVSPPRWHVWRHPKPNHTGVADILSLNRAICECVAKTQVARDGEYVNSRREEA